MKERKKEKKRKEKKRKEKERKEKERKEKKRKDKKRKEKQISCRKKNQKERVLCKFFLKYKSKIILFFVCFTIHINYLKKGVKIKRKEKEKKEKREEEGEKKLPDRYGAPI